MHKVIMSIFFVAWLTAGCQTAKPGRVVQGQLVNLDEDQPMQFKFGRRR